MNKSIKRRYPGRIIALFVIFLFCFICIGLLSAQEPAADSSDNLAYRRPYKLSVMPTTTWYHIFRKQHKSFPDMNHALTDGKLCKGKYFWVSNRCLNFSGASPVDVIIDLGKVFPIAGIFTHHGSNPPAGIAQPSRESYYCSIDNVKFFKVGEYINRFDPAYISEVNKKNFLSGLKTFTSGKIKAKGRYVLVRTWGIRGNPENPGIIHSGYVGHDEIIVKRGNFNPAEVKLDMKKAIKIQQHFSAALTGYPYHSRDWQKFFTRTPLAFLLVPNSFRGCKTYHMSVGGVYALDFAAIDNSTDKPSGITFRCSFPDTVEIIEVNRLLKTSREKETIGGKPYTTVVQQIKYPGYIKKPLFVVAPKPTEPSDNIGSVIYSWSYKQHEKLYSSAKEKFRIVLEKKLSAPAPKRFKTGVWASSSFKCLADKYGTSKRLFEFYKDIGFNWIDGGHSDAGIYRAANELGFDSCFEKDTCPNGFAVCQYDRNLKPLLKKEIPFIYANGKPGRYGVCPAKFLTGKYDRQYIDSIKKDLLTTRDIYVNWEPYMFQKKGCVCEACKQSFQKFAKLSEAEVNDMWPRVVTDWNNKRHNEFFSWQLAGMIRKTQDCVDIAAKEMGLDYKPDFIPSLSPIYLNPRHAWYKIHNPKYYMPSINKLILWSYINDINPFVFSREKLTGNNLSFLPALNKCLVARKKYGRKDASGHYLPKLYFLQTQYFFAQALVLPKDYYFTSVLVFLMGFDGYGTWQETDEQEARYLKQHVRANRFISKYEDVVLDGQVVPGFTIQPAQRQKTDKPILFCRAFRYKKKIYVAVGNDSLKKVKAVLKSTKQSDVSITAESTKKKYRINLKKGITINIPEKAWFMFVVQ